MLAKDIKVGRAYAVNYWGSSRGRYAAYLGSDSLERGVVVSEPKGGKVEVKMEGRIVSVELGRVKGTWSEHKALLKANRKYKEEAIREMQAVVAETARYTGKRKKDLPVDGEVSRDGSYSTYARVSVYELRDLVKAAYEKGRRDAEVKS